MAQRLDTVTPDILDPNATYEDGAYLDEDVSVPGSPSLAGAANSQYYFFHWLMKKANTLFNGTVDNSLESQYYDALVVSQTESEDAPLWSSGTSYGTEGTLVRDSLGDVYSSTAEAGNLNKDPSDIANKAYWYPCDDNKDLRKLAKRGKPLLGDFHPIHDRNDSLYAQNLLVGKKTIGDDDYEMHMVHLDGTTLDGNAELTDLLTGYPYLDKFAPDSGGIRTLLDAGDYVFTPQSDSGDNDVVGELVADQIQGHWHDFTFTGQAASSSVLYVSHGGTQTGTADSTTVASGEGIKAPITDGVNGTPRVGSTTHGKRMTVGSPYIIVMKKIA